MSSKIKFIDKSSSDYCIVLPTDHSVSQYFAAQEFKNYIKKSTEVDLEIIIKDSDLPAKAVILGHHPEGLTLMKDVGLDELQDEGFFWKFTDGRLVIAGSKVRGTLYGVYSFLEEFLGIQFLDPEFTVIPETMELYLPRESSVHKPSFEYRMVTYLSLLDPDYTSKVKCNMNPFGEPEQGGSIMLSTAHLTHTFYQLVNPKKYYEDHPEYFAMVDGKRISNMGQLCLSNPDVMRIAADNVLKWFEEDPRIMSMGVIQNDIFNYCECDNCRKIEQSHGGVHSAPIIRFCNAIAEKVKEKYPNDEKYIHTIAYTYSLEPPEDMYVHERVIVVPCDMYPDCADHAPVGQDPLTKDYLEIVKKWIDIADTVLVWHYAVDFVHFLLPFPNFRSLYENAKIYNDIGVKGILYQSTTQLGVYGEFEEFRNWFSYKVLWNTDVDYDEIVNDFITGYYGDAAPTINAYFTELQAMANELDVKMHLYSGLEAGYLDLAFVKKYQRKILSALEKVSDDPEISSHVEKVLLSLDYAYLIFPVEFEAKLGKIMTKDQPYRKEVFRRFEAMVRKLAIAVVSESVPVSAFLARQRILSEEQNILAIAEMAPTVMAILKSLFNKVRQNLDEKNNFVPNDYIVTALKSGFHPLELNNWMNEKELGQWTTDADIWTRKFDLDRADAMLNPKPLKTKKSDLPGAVMGMIKGVPNQVDSFDDQDL